MKEYIILLIPSLLTATGFVCRYFWERHIKYRNVLNLDHKKNISFKLEKFYYPLHFNLNRLSNMWEIIKDNKKLNENNNEIDIECMNLHIENQDIIKSNIVQAKPIPKLIEAIMKYDKHVTINKVLKIIGKPCDCPRNYDAEYPDEFKDIIKSRIDILENELI